MLKWIEINIPAILHNLREVRERLRPGTKLMAVVKADAYGHGALEVSSALVRNNVQCLGVLTMEEALELRKRFSKIPLILLAPVLKEYAEEILRHRLIPTLDNMDFAEALQKKSRTPVSIYVDLDMGLGRWGVTPRQLPRFLKRISLLGKIKVLGLSTHLDYVAGKNMEETEEKLKNFRRIFQNARHEIPSLTCHAANSSLFLDFPQWQMDMVRIGNLLYGINPTSKSMPLRNPWKFQAKIISVKRIPKGTPIGYGSEYTASKDMRIGTLPVGYSDGLTMEPADRWIRLGGTYRYWGTMGNSQLPFVGRCGISHVLVDLSGVPDTKVGDVVTLPIRRTAANPRIPRTYFY